MDDLQQYQESHEVLKEKLHETKRLVDKRLMRDFIFKRGACSCVMFKLLNQGIKATWMTENQRRKRHYSRVFCLYGEVGVKMRFDSGW